MGKYVESHLIAGEVLQYETRHHWRIFLSFSSIFTLGIYPLLRMRTDEFAITNKRIIIKTGILSTQTLEMNLPKIESVNVQQGIIGRLLGYGDLQIIGTGGTRELFPCIHQPQAFRKAFQELG